MMTSEVDGLGGSSVLGEEVEVVEDVTDVELEGLAVVGTVVVGEDVDDFGEVVLDVGALVVVDFGTSQVVVVVGWWAGTADRTAIRASEAITSWPR